MGFRTGACFVVSIALLAGCGSGFGVKDAEQQSHAEYPKQGVGTYTVAPHFENTRQSIKSLFIVVPYLTIQQKTATLDIERQDEWAQMAIPFFRQELEAEVRQRVVPSVKAMGIESSDNGAALAALYQSIGKLDPSAGANAVRRQKIQEWRKANGLLETPDAIIAIWGANTVFTKGHRLIQWTLYPVIVAAHLATLHPEGLNYMRPPTGGITDATLAIVDGRDGSILAHTTIHCEGKCDDIREPEAAKELAGRLLAGFPFPGLYKINALDR